MTKPETSSPSFCAHLWRSGFQWLSVSFDRISSEALPLMSSADDLFGSSDEEEDILAEENVEEVVAQQILVSLLSNDCKAR